MSKETEAKKELFSKGRYIVRVQYKLFHMPTGTVTEARPAFKINGATFSSAGYRVKWDNPEDGVSGWLKENELIFLT